MLIALLLLAGILSEPFARAALPDWAKSPTFTPYEDGAYRYYRGEAKSAPDRETAVREATARAVLQAIEDSVGPVPAHDPIVKAFDSGQSSPPELSDLLRYFQLYDFSQWELAAERVKPSRSGSNTGLGSADADSSETDDDEDPRAHVWILFRYSREEREKERKLLFLAKNELDGAFRAPPSLEQLGAWGGLQIESNPPLAKVVIDGKLRGGTPLRVPISAELLPGPHDILWHHPFLEPWGETAWAVPGEVTQLDPELVSRTGMIDVVTEPEGASVIVGGKPVGVTPTGEVPVAVGRRVQVEISHSQTDRVVRQIRVPEDGVVHLEVKLPEKPAYLSVTSDPSAASVALDGEALGKGRTPTGMVRVDPGEHELTVDQEGYMKFEKEINLVSGQKFELPIVRLRPSDPVLALQSDQNKEVLYQPIILGLQLTLDGNTYASAPVSSYLSFQFSVARRIYGRLSLRVGLSLDGIHSSAQLPNGFGNQPEGAASVRGYTGFLGMPIRILPWKTLRETGNWLSLSPECGLSRHHLVVESGSVSGATDTLTVTDDEFLPQYYGALGLEYSYLPDDPNTIFGLTAWGGFRSYNTYRAYSATTSMELRAGALVRF